MPQTMRDEERSNALGQKRKREIEEPPDDEALLQLIDQAPPVEALDLFGLKKMVLTLERKINKNQEMRMKFADQAEKFMDSEVELHDALKALHALAAAPDLFAEFINLGCHTSLVGLLSHENTDIAIDTVELINELTDPEASEDLKNSLLLLDALLEGNLLELLTQNLPRLDEKNPEDSQCVYNTLSIIENVTELKPEMANIIVQKTNILQYLFDRLKIREIDANRVYASEMLAILLQSSKENQAKVGEMDGIDMLLKLVAPYKRRDPTGGEEIELMENLFDALCSCLLVPANQNLFHNAEGLELMIIIIKEKKAGRKPALKVLDYACSRCPQNCERFVDILGIKTLFAAFMGKGVAGKKKNADVDEDEEHIISTIASMFAHLKGARLQRLLGKFTENDFEKIDRLVELHRKYSDRVAACEKRIRQQQLDDDDDFDPYVERLDNGLFSLQYIAFIIANIVAASLPGTKDRIKVLLNQSDSSIDDVKTVLQEYADNFGDALSKEERSKERARLTQLIDELNDWAMISAI